VAEEGWTRDDVSATMLMTTASVTRLARTLKRCMVDTSLIASYAAARLMSSLPMMLFGRPERTDAHRSGIGTRVQTVDAQIAKASRDRQSEHGFVEKVDL
jgi:hypothetical protein